MVFAAVVAVPSILSRALPDTSRPRSLKICRILRRVVITRTNNGQLPTDLSQLKPYFTSDLDDATLDAVLARYKLLHTGTLSDLPPDGWIVAEKAPVDKD